MGDPMGTDNRQRCDWPGDDPLMIRYHDDEWGIPVHNDQKWFEFIVLDGFQAGLAWRTVLHKREAFREVFFEFDPEKVARMPDMAIAEAMANPAIIRNRLKIKAAVKNARAFLQIQERHDTFDNFIWSFTDGRVIHNPWPTPEAIPATTDLSDEISKSMKKHGFTFVGSTICYAFLQAAGVVNDHLIDCFRWQELKALSSK